MTIRPLRTALAAGIVCLCVAGTTVGDTVFINEVDYDMVGSDTAEWLELVGTAGTSLDGWTIELINGANDTEYGTSPISLPNFTFSNETGNGWGFFVLGLGPATVDFTPVGWNLDELQNGAPDRIRLLDPTNTEVHLFNYEAGDGVVGTVDSTSAGDSNSVTRVLAKTGTGNTFADFTWSQQDTTGTPGAINTDQTLNDPPAMNGGGDDPDYAYVLPESGVANKLTIDFTGFAGTGFEPSPVPGRLDSDNWAVKGVSDGDTNFGDTATSGDHARGSSGVGVTSGGVYAFDHGGGDVGLGFQPSGSDFTPGSLDLYLPNSTGGVITDLAIMYDIWVYNDAGDSNSLDFAYSTDGIVFTDVEAADFASTAAAAGTPAWEQFLRSFNLSGLSIADGGFIILRWLTDEVSNDGSSDQIAIDNIMVTNLTGVDGGAAVPAPAALSAGLVLGALALTRRRRRAA